MKSRNFVTVLLAVGIASLVGCKDDGPKLGTVSGIVTLEGEPVEGALIEFMPSTGRGSISPQRTGSDGYYELQYVVDRKGALIGKHQVQITTSYDDKDVETGVNTRIKERLPAWYSGPTSVLEFDVQEGENEANFELSKKKPKGWRP